MRNAEFERTKGIIQQWIDVVSEDIEKELIAAGQQATAHDPNRPVKELMKLFNDAKDVGYFYFKDFAQLKVALGMSFNLCEKSKTHFLSGEISDALLAIKNAQEFLSLAPNRLALINRQDFISIVHNIKVGDQLKINLESSFLEAKNKLATAAATARHVKTHKKEKEIITYWRANIGIDKSNEFAGELLQKQFPDVSHRTLVKYVAETKKLLSAGKV